MSFDSLLVDKEKNFKACKSFIGKLNLLGANIDTILRYKNTDEIILNVLTYAALQNYPRTLHIPNFVCHITDQFGENYYTQVDKKAVSQVKQIIIPDSVQMDREAYKSLRCFPKLKQISIGSRQKLLWTDIKASYKVRIPEVANMIVTDKSKALMDFILKKGYSTIKGTDLMIAYEIAGRAADEETALAALSCQALESKVCLVDDLKPYVSSQTVESLKSLYESNLNSYSEKALAIKTNTLLSNIFKLRRYVEKQYDIETNRLLYEQIDYPGQGIFDIGQRFKPNLTIEGNCLQGFSDDGWLGYFQYTITGKVLPDEALDIIRLSTDPIMYRIDGVKMEQSYRHLDLDFFKQYWNVSDIAPVWCYPNGDIHRIGYTCGTDIQSIIIEACCLAAEFNGLCMTVNLKSQNKDYNPYSQEDIIINIEHGAVSVYPSCRKISTHVVSIDREYIAMIHNLRKSGQPIFTQEQLLTMQSRNQYESLLNTEKGEQQRELQNKIAKIGLDLQCRLSGYTQEIIGLKVTGRHTSTLNMLKYIFDYDPEKLETYLIEFEKDRVKRVTEKERLESGG